MERAKAKEYEARVASTRMVTSDVHEVVFEVQGPDPVPLLAGQFMNLKVPRPDGPRPWLRSYSIVSPASDGSRLAILVDTDPDGPGSRYLNQLTVGDTVAFKGPLGLFHLRDPADTRVLIAANVSAIGACHAVAQAILARQPERRVTLLFQLKREDELFWHKELLELSRRHPNFDHLITVAEPSPSWTGSVGPLSAHLKARIGDPASVEAYLAGLGPVVNELRDLLLEAGVPKERIAIERFSTASSKDDKDD